MDYSVSLIKNLFSEEIKVMLKNLIDKLEYSLKSDVLAYYGLFCSETRDEFIKLVNELADNKTHSNDKLIIILYTNGGYDDFYINAIEHIFSKYKSFDIIVPDLCLSAGTIFCFAANTIYINYSSTRFGRIDPQRTFNIGNKQRRDSIFYEIIQRGGGFCFSELKNENDFHLENIYEIYDNKNNCSDLKKEIDIFTSRCYNYLINHNLKDNPNKHKIAIQIISDLLSTNKYPFHSFRIPASCLAEKGLNIIKYDEIQEIAGDIFSFHSIVSNILYNATLSTIGYTNYGNSINFLMQTREHTII